MLLKDLFPKISNVSVPLPFKNVDIQSIATDSRCVVRESLFVALPGSTSHGAHFIEEAIQRGASSIVVGRDYAPSGRYSHICFVVVDNPKEALREAVRQFYGNPSLKVKTIGVTGTNGKTTITYLIESILKKAGKPCGVVGTINYRVGDRAYPSHNTTPGLIDNQVFLSNLAKENIDYCVMEVSSHALDQGRVDLIDFHAAIFTNLTSDHLDYHKTRENYFLAKAKLFAPLSLKATAIINSDDEYATRLLSLTKSKVLTYGIYQPSDFVVKHIELDMSGTTFTCHYPQGKIRLHSPLVGLHNAYNVVAALAFGLCENIPLEAIRQGIENFHCVPGRLERVSCGQNFSIFIDYAHTEDALRNALKALRHFAKGKIILVFGCGGDRDKTKRPLMGKVASELAHFSIVTSDNPRGEEPQGIINEILPGFKNKNYTAIVDRKEAIATALTMAKRDDVVLVAGKGHETYQIFKDKTIPFDEREVIQDFFKEYRLIHQN